MPYLTYRLTQISSAAIKAADPLYHAAVGLKIRELRVLRLIHDYPHHTARELLRRIELDKTLLSKNLSFLEAKGCITRQNDPDDARRQYIDLTKKGEEIWQTAEQIGQALEKQMFAGLKPGQWQQLHDLLDHAWDSLQDWKKQEQESKKK